MSKPAMLSDDAYEALQANKRNPKESLSDVILRFVPPKIETFGDLEKHLENMDGPPAGVDWDALVRLKERKRKGRQNAR